MFLTKTDLVDCCTQVDGLPAPSVTYDVTAKPGSGNGPNQSI